MLADDDVEFYRIQLRRTDDVSISMTTEGATKTSILDTARTLCDLMIEGLPFYADQDAACHSEVFTCLDKCMDQRFSGSWDMLP